MPRHSRVFRKFLISYIVILLIPSFAGYMSYRTSISVAQSISIENSIDQLQKSKDILERRIAEVEGFTKQLALNQDLSILMNEKNTDGKLNVYGIWKMMRFVRTYASTNNFLQNFFIYLKNYDVILTPGSTYFRPEHYYENYHYRDYPFSEWKKEILGTTHRSEIMPLRPFVAKDMQISVITYMQSLPLDRFSDSSPAVVVVIIDERLISSLLSGITDRYGGWVYIGDAQGRIISLQGIGEREIAKMASDTRFDPHKVSQFYEDYLVITVRSDTNQWVYQVGIPSHVLMENANKIKSITWTVMVFALLIGLLVGLLLAYRNSIPIHQLIGIVKEQFGQAGNFGRNEYDFLHGNISEMIRNSKRLEMELRRQQPLVRDAFFKRLIAGEFQTREEILVAAVQASVELNGNVGYVGIVQIHGYYGMDSVEILNELNAARFVLKQVLLDLVNSIFMTDLGSDKIVILFVFPEEENVQNDEINGLLHHFSQLVFNKYKISISVALSDRFNSITEISHAFERAKQTLEYAVQLNKKGILWYDDMRMESDIYYYPLDLEMRLISTIRAGEVGEAKRIFQSIMAQNMANRELSLEMKYQLVSELKGTFLKLLDQKTFLESGQFETVKDRIVNIRATETLESLCTEINVIIELLCGMVRSKKNDMQKQIVEQIKQYISEKYGDAQLTLYMVAEHVERPEKFISQLFKEVTGMNLSDYLEQVRMEHAVAFLKSNKYTIDEIAERVGYNSSHSFRRAFKRVMGVSPSAYRQSISD